MPVLLLVEDDRLLGKGLCSLLAQQGYPTTWAADLSAARHALDTRLFYLLLLDERLPDGNGIEFCRTWRKTADTPVIFLTDCDAEADMIKGLDAGADDYIDQTIFCRRLALTHPGGAAPAATGARRTVQKRGAPHADRSTPNLLERHGTGFDTHRIQPAVGFLHSQGRTMSRKALQEKIWDTGRDFVANNTLSVHLLRLRRKLGDTADRPVYIKTKRGTGYCWLPRVIQE